MYIYAYIYVYIHPCIYIHIYMYVYTIYSLRAFRWAKMRLLCSVAIYVFLRNILSHVLIWHLPEHELKPLGGLWGGPRWSEQPLGVPRGSWADLGLVPGFWGPFGVPGLPGGRWKVLEASLGISGVS